MITIAHTETVDEFQPYAVTATYSLPDHATTTDAVSALVTVLRASGYIDGSIYSALVDVADDLFEHVDVSYKSIKEQQCDN